jgi:aminopeptidase N
MKTDTPRPILLKEYRPPNYLIEAVKLDIALHPTRTRVRARLKIKPNPDAGGNAGPLRLDGELLELESVRLDGRQLGLSDFKCSDKELVISAPPHGPFTLETVAFCNPEANKALTGLYLSRGIYCTQCEAQGFRRITYFLDRPDVLSTYTVRLEADREGAPVLLSNGNPVERGILEGGKRHYAVWRDPFPKPSYLFAVVGGNLAPFASDFTTASGRKVDLRIYVEPGREGRCAWAMDSLKRSMRWDEERFGREYDLSVFNIVAVSDFNMGAMENKGLNIFNDALVLATPETATDSSFFGIERVIAHEYFHNWTGNRITCRDWFQLCLKEGLTVFRDQEFSADQRSRPVERISDVRGLRAVQFVEDAGPLAHPVRPEVYHEINNFYTATVYEKGAEVVRMLSVLLGPEKFRAGMDLYFERHDGEAATIEQFVQCFADASGVNLTQFMRWYSQAGTPEVVATGSYDAAQRSYRLDVTQTVPATPGQPVKEPMVIPLVVGLVGDDGQDVPLTLSDGRQVARGVVALTKSSESFVFTDVAQRVVPSLNRGFSAPIQLTANLSSDDLQFLAARDPDSFNRWQAIQTLATRLLVARATSSAIDGRDEAGLIEALGATLADPALENALIAQAITLPSEADIAREIGRDVDPDAIHAARRALRTAIGRRLGEPLAKTYERLSDSSPYQPDAAGAGRRALRNACLDLMAVTLIVGVGLDTSLMSSVSHLLPGQSRNL